MTTEQIHMNVALAANIKESISRQIKTARDRRAAALSVIGHKRHLLTGHLASLPQSDNLRLQPDTQTRRDTLRAAIAVVNAEFLAVASKPLTHFLHT